MCLKSGPSHLVQSHALISYNFPAGAPFSNLIGVMPLVEIQTVCRKNPGAIINTIRLSTMRIIQTQYRDCMNAWNLKSLLSYITRHKRLKSITVDINFRNQLSLYIDIDNKSIKA